ncbi:hypothetical protein PSAL_034390 [Pseudooceanicola algae]|uniref:Uncharacterized protein n=2 Tax=Pseudooceanicola algae TaxID=1537215 RepID=A0A418SK22_9RHOB|nr:hypothetical protein PSAL_034390 [Pseudooceanicola algae]
MDQWQLKTGEFIRERNGRFAVDGHGCSIAAVAGTDLFHDPAGAPPVDNAPGIRFGLGRGPVLFSALVKPQFSKTFDAGTFTVRTAAGA